jgi:L-iditol 2-dehydrogenase
MKALLLSEPGKLGVTDMPVPDISEEDILVRVRACGICGSDVHGYDGSSGRRIPPLVMGHEAAGVVERAGAGVTAFQPGDRVTFDSTVYCGRCEFCRRGAVNLCDNRMVLGVSCGDYRRHGAFAEYVAVPARIACKLPDHVPFEHAAVIEALSVAVHAVGRKAPGPDEAVLVIGCGMIGLLVVQVLRARGARRVIAVDVDAPRRHMAERAGATWTFDGSDPRLLESIRSLTGGRGADLALEAVGRTETIQAAIRGVRKGGTVIVIGNLAPRVELPLQELVTREISLLGSCASSGEYPACVDLIASGAVDVAPLISATAPLEEGPSWFERLHRGGEPLMKVILQP